VSSVRGSADEELGGSRVSTINLRFTRTCMGYYHRSTSAYVAETECLSRRPGTTFRAQEYKAKLIQEKCNQRWEEIKDIMA